MAGDLDIYFNIRNEKEMELNIYERGIVFHASTEASYDSKTKKAMKSVETQLNHFLMYLTKRDERDNDSNDLHYFMMKMISLNDKLDRNKLEDIARKNAEITVSTIKKEKVSSFKDTLYSDIVYDKYLLKLISEYSFESSKHNLKVSKNIDEKLYYSDLHIYQALSVYSKIFYLLYFRVSEHVGYSTLINPMNIKLSGLLNEDCLELFPDEYNIIKNRSFMDRLFSFIEFSNRRYSRSHKRLFNKFAAIGYSHEFITRKILDHTFTSFKSFLPKPHEKKIKTKIYRFDEHDFDDWGYVSLLTANWINAITRNVVNNLSKHTTKFVINTINPGFGGENDETPESSKYEILLEKKDREHYEDMRALKEFIIEDSTKHGRLSSDSLEFIDYLIENKTDIKHLLNELMVSLFLEQEYGVNVSDLLTYKEYLIIVFRIYEALEGYYHLTHAMVSPEAEQQYGTNLSQEELEKIDFHTYGNNYRVSKILNKIIGKSYTTQTPKGNIQYLNVKNDIVDFIERGMMI